METYSRYLLVRPQDLNHAGTLFGGAMMAFADEMAFIAATLTYPGCTFVTKVFKEFNFINGPTEGEIVKIDAQVLHKGRTSVTVAVKATEAASKRDIFQTEAVLVNASHGRSVPIPESPASGNSA